MLVEAWQAESDQRGRSGGQTHVLVMKPTEVGQGDNRSRIGRLGSAAIRCIFVQSQVRSRPMIVAQVRNDDPTQVLLVEHDHVVKALSPDGADQPFHVGRLPGRSRCDRHLVDTHPAHPSTEVSAVDAVSIAGR